MKFIHAVRILLPLVSILLLLPACEFDEQFDPNGPSIGSVQNDATIAELNLLVTGIEARTRNGLSSQYYAPGTIARELYIFDADPRNTSDLLGKGDNVLDNNTFYLTGPYISFYRVVKNANLLLEAVQNTSQVSEAEAAGYRAFANTMKAWMFSQALVYLGDNGVRVDVADPESLRGFLTTTEGYSFILDLFDQANAELSGAEFAFLLTSGFDGFNTPETFGLVNRALAARAAIQGELHEEALNLVDGSFFDLDGDISIGPEHTFSTNPGDILNPLFRAPGQSGDQIVVHPDIVSGVQVGDSRSSKWRERTQPTDKDGLNGTQETALYPTATSPADIIRNEELILIWAEANLQTGDLEDAVTGLNVIRNANGLDDFDGDENDRDALIDELLYNRTYSLWSEGHRMFDLRRYGRLNADFLSIDREGDDVFTQFPVPLSEL